MQVRVPCWDPAVILAGREGAPAAVEAAWPHAERSALRARLLRVALASGAVRFPPLQPRPGVVVPCRVRETLQDAFSPEAWARGEFVSVGQLAEALEASPPQTEPAPALLPALPAALGGDAPEVTDNSSSEADSSSDEDSDEDSDDDSSSEEATDASSSDEAADASSSDESGDSSRDKSGPGRSSAMLACVAERVAGFVF
jgi:hypothetical protein